MSGWEILAARIYFYYHHGEDTILDDLATAIVKEIKLYSTEWSHLFPNSTDFSVHPETEC